MLLILQYISVKIVEVDMRIELIRKITHLLNLLKYKPLERFKDYRGRLFTQRYIRSTDISRLQIKSFEGSVFFRCAVSLDSRDPNATYIDCYENMDNFIEERDSLRDELDFENFDFAEFTETSINHCTLDGLSMPHAGFSGMQLESVSFVNCNLVGADFSDATVKNCDFRNADLNSAHLGAEFTDCNFYNADLSYAETFGLDADIRQFQDVADLPEGFIRCGSCDIVLEAEDARYYNLFAMCWDCYEEHVCQVCGEESSDLDGERICETCRDASEDDESWD